MIKFRSLIARYLEPRLENGALVIRFKGDPIFADGEPLVKKPVREFIAEFVAEYRMVGDMVSDVDTAGVQASETDVLMTIAVSVAAVNLDAAKALVLALFPLSRSHKVFTDEER